MNLEGRLSAKGGQSKTIRFLRTLRNILSGSMVTLMNLFGGKIVTRMETTRYKEGYLNGTVMFRRLGSVQIPSYILKEVEKYGEDYKNGFVDGWLDAYNALRKQQKGGEEG